MDTRYFKQQTVISTLIGLIITGLLLVLPFSLAELLGAVILITLPGFWIWRLLGFQSSIRSPFTWAATFLTSLVVVPLAVNVTGMAFGLNPVVIFSTLAILTILAAIVARHRTIAPEPLLENKLPTWILALLVGLGGFLALLVAISYLPIKTPDGLPWVTIGDWDKHGALIWTIADTGIPPEDIFLGSAPPQTLTYYYFFHLLAAIFHILTHQSFDLRLIFIIPVAALAFSFPLLLFNLAYSLFKRARLALLTTYFVIWVGGLDLVIVWYLMGRQNLSRISVKPWLTFLLHSDAWAPPKSIHINVFYAYIIWMPHHLAALGLLVAAWFLWIKRPQWRFSRFWAPALFASMMGFSVYVSIAAFAGLGAWLAWESLIILGKRNGAWRKYGSTWTLRGIWLVALTALLAGPMLWLYWQGHTPGRGVAFGPPTLGIDNIWPALTQPPLNAPGLRPFIFLLDYLFEFGIGLFLLAFGIDITIKAYRSSTWAQNNPLLNSLLHTPIWRWMFSTGILALVLISLFQSSGSKPDAGVYATLNDFGMRVIMPLQIVLGLLASMFILWWRQHPRHRVYLWVVSLIAAILIIPGILVTAREMYAMGFAKYKLHWVIPNSRLQALAYVRTQTPEDFIIQQSVNTIPEQYLLAQRHPGLWGRTAPLISADQPRGFQLVKIFREAFQTQDAERSANLFANNNIDLIMVGAGERTPNMHPEKYQDERFFHLIFDNGDDQVYQIKGEKPLPTKMTLSAQAKQARDEGRIDKARELYADAVEQESDPNIRKHLLMQWATMERFKNPEAAVSLFQQVIAIDPSFVEAHANLGATFLSLGRLEEAVSELTTVTRKAPKHYWAWRLLGSAYEKQGNWDQAIDAYRHATEVAKAGSKEQSAVAAGMLRSAVQSGQCTLARFIVQQYADLLSAQSEDVSSALAACQ